MTPSILIIDDDQAVRDTYATVLHGQGLRTESAATLKDGLAAARQGTFDLVLLDINLPDGSGLDMVREIAAAPSSPEVIVITGLGTEQSPEQAIFSGAWDYLEKPPSIAELSDSITRALEFRRQRCNLTVEPSLDRSFIIGESAELERCLVQVAHAAASEANVLITGETGTGKELFARAIHANSCRRDGPFMVIDCTTLPETLVEAILFGHERGAFTGAERQQVGLIKQADGGTLFLDEIGELPPGVQGKFLRVLQERRFRPIGSTREETSDFRVIAATNSDLGEMIARDAFREDLFFRIRTIQLHLPPLAQRCEDLEPLARHFAAEACRRYNQAAKGFSSDFLAALQAHPWPGNVRELQHAMERAVVQAGQAPMLFAVNLPEYIRLSAVRASLPRGQGRRPAPGCVLRDLPAVAPAEQSQGRREEPLSWKAFKDSVLSQVTRDYLVDLLDQAGGHAGKASQLAGLSQSRFYELLKLHNLK